MHTEALALPLSLGFGFKMKSDILLKVNLFSAVSLSELATTVGKTIRTQV